MIVTYVMVFVWSLHLMLKKTTAHEGAWLSKCDGAAEPSVRLNQKDTLDLNGHGPDWYYCSDCTVLSVKHRGGSVLTWDCMGGEMGKNPFSFMKLERRGTLFFFTKIPKTLKQLRLFKRRESATCHLTWIWTPLVFFKVESRATKPTCVRDWYHPCPRGSSLSSKNKRSHWWKMFVVLRLQFEA